MKSSEIKQYFKKIGIPVKVRTVACKRPFAQVWIESATNYPQPITYKYEFPLEMRQKLLRIIYGENCEFAAGGSAGNVRAHDFSGRNGDDFDECVAWKEIEEYQK